MPALHRQHSRHNSGVLLLGNTNLGEKTLISECIRFAPALHCSYQVMDKNSSQLLLQGDCFLANPENRKPLSYFFNNPADYDKAIHLFLQVFDQDKSYQLQRIAEHWLTGEQ